VDDAPLAEPAVLDPTTLAASSPATGPHALPPGWTWTSPRTRPASPPKAPVTEDQDRAAEPDTAPAALANTPTAAPAPRAATTPEQPTVVADTPAGPPAGLTELQASVLRFEQRTWRYRAAKDEAIRAELGLSPTRYYQLLNALVESPAALAAEPVLVGRLARLRASRRHGWSPATMPPVAHPRGAAPDPMAARRPDAPGAGPRTRA
jgi:hypothetical protein